MGEGTGREWWSVMERRITYLLVFLHHGLLLQKFLHQNLLLPLSLLVVLLRLLRRRTDMSRTHSYKLFDYTTVDIE